MKHVALGCHAMSGITAGHDNVTISPRPVCPRCKSPDTIGYWTIKPRSAMDEYFAQLLKDYYPNARKCVDCEHVWW